MNCLLLRSPNLIWWSSVMRAGRVLSSRLPTVVLMSDQRITEREIVTRSARVTGVSDRHRRHRLGRANDTEGKR